MTSSSQFNPGEYSVDIEIVTSVDGQTVNWDTPAAMATVADADLAVPSFTVTNSGVSTFSSFKLT